MTSGKSGKGGGLQFGQDYFLDYPKNQDFEGILLGQEKKDICQDDVGLSVTILSWTLRAKYLFICIAYLVELRRPTS